MSIPTLLAGKAAGHLLGGEGPPGSPPGSPGPGRGRRGPGYTGLAVICAVLALLLVFSVGFGLRLFNFGLPHIFGNKATVKTPSVVLLGQIKLEDRYDVLARSYPPKVEKQVCKTFFGHDIPGTCIWARFETIAVAHVTEQLGDYRATVRYNRYPTAGHKGDVKVNITLYSQPRVADPDQDITLLVQANDFVKKSGILSQLTPDISYQEMEASARQEAKRYAAQDSAMLAQARQEFVRIITDDFQKKADTFGYTAHVQVAFAADRHKAKSI